MTLPRWLALRRRPQPEVTRTAEPEAHSLPGPQGPWLTDPDFRARLRSATLTMLDLVENVMEDDFTLTESIDGFRYHAAELLNIPAEYGVLVEAEAAAQIVEAAGLPAGSPFGLSIAQGLACIQALSIEDQQNLVRAAARRYAINAPTHRPARARPAPPSPTGQPSRSTR
ncbi:hypothetical protein [Streptomyces deccanensis]|uniref:hypothetical protein n=1 Tax=Streptomyces deccanensis TaxID=424188 RepID=UPI001EFB8A4F|nr:hypothetical protein [Streptomyces deccanensis]ULR53931.1 hypothetical protein L3078_34230 [Streptomyces deccanensis]